MHAVAYAYLGPEAAAAKYAKRGAPSDIALLDGKKDDATLNIIVPIRYPDKLQSLLAALDLADFIVLHPEALDRTFGEQVVGASLFGKTQGFVRLGPNVPMDAVKQILDKTDLKGLEINNDPEAVFREKLYAGRAAPAPGGLALPIDHAFPVKGVGTVALGRVRVGEVQAHQVLQAFPSDLKAEVRSIQVHDVDVPTAPAGSRVGLAMKGIEATDLPRGTVLAPPGSIRVAAAGEALKVTIDVTPFNKWVPRTDAVLHVYHALQDVVVRVASIDPVKTGPWKADLKPEAPLAIVPGQPMVLVDLDQKTQRFVGRARLA